jgi:Ala-tRNA(Pro) deacylase
MTDETLPTTPAQLFTLLDDLGIGYTRYDHDPIFTVEEGLHLKKDIPGTHCRNLYLRDKKKRNFLLTVTNDTQVDLKTLPDKLGCGRLSFGSRDRLWENLGIRPGAVTPFCAVNDTDHAVKIILDSVMMEANLVCVHPLDNAMTVSLTPDDLLKFFTHTGHEPLVVDFSSS